MSNLCPIAIPLFVAGKNFEKVPRLDSLMFLVTLVASEDSHRMPNLPSGTASNHGFRQLYHRPRQRRALLGCTCQYLLHRRIEVPRNGSRSRTPFPPTPPTRAG